MLENFKIVKKLTFIRYRDIIKELSKRYEIDNSYKEEERKMDERCQGCGYVEDSRRLGNRRE